MSIHDGFLELAATAIDFDLEDDERAELERHLAGCDACRRTAAAFHEDAAAIAYGTAPRLSPARSVEILATALRPPKSGPPIRLLAVAALVAVLGAGLVAAGMEFLRRADNPIIAVVPSSSPSSGPGPSSGPTTSPGPTGQPPAVTPRPAASPASGALPVRGSGQQLGTGIRMAPGAIGDLWVSIPAPGGTTLARLGGDGTMRSGWPIVLPGAGSCGLLLPVNDGSVRLVCHADDLADDSGVAVRAFAFDAGGSLLPGWPVVLPCCFTGRMLGDELTVYGQEYFGGDIEEGQPAGEGRIVAVAADGSIRSGTPVPFGLDSCPDSWAVGPGGVAYGTLRNFSGPSPTSALLAVGFDGVPAGFPVEIGGIASGPSFDPRGLIHVTVGSPVRPPARTLVFNSDGGTEAGSDEVEITATSDWTGAGGDCPAPPLVGESGLTFLVDTTDGTTIAGLGANGQVMSGWPYESDREVQVAGFCGTGDTGCGGFHVGPTLGLDNTLYLAYAAATASAGGSVLAIEPDGTVRSGWPVNLRRPGAEFWSVVVGPDLTVYALAIEPEPNGSYSATILSIAPDSSVRYTVTIVEP